MTEPLVVNESEHEGGANATATELDVLQSHEKLESVNEDDHQQQQEDDDEAAPPAKPLDKLAAFALQLMEEFLAQHELDDTLSAMQAELKRKGIPRPDDQLWCEMYNSCRVALARGGSSVGSTLERLLAFCTSPKAARATGALMLDSPISVCLASPKPNSISKAKQTTFTLRQAQNQMLSPVVRPSQRHKQPGTPSSTPSAEATRQVTIDAIIPESKSDSTWAELDINGSRPSSSETQHQSVPSIKKYRPKKKRSYGNESNNRVLSKVYLHPSRAESSMVISCDEQIKRDLSCGRLLARELRNLRVERVMTDSVRRGAASLEAALARHDPYAKELVREQYGFIRRVECALCTFPFLPVNLPHRVSFKCIMDLHEFWGYTPPQRELAARYRPPLCYDAVSVCRLCGPILFQHTTATPNAYDEQLSPTMPRAHSLSALSTTSKVSPKTKVRAAMIDADNTERRMFCSDPYALPPLFGDDVIEDGGSYAGEEVSNETLQRTNGVGPMQESPAKAIVYSQQQTDTAVFMSSKEWEIINPTRSNIRQVMESTVKGI